MGSLPTSPKDVTSAVFLLGFCVSSTQLGSLSLQEGIKSSLCSEFQGAQELTKHDSPNNGIIYFADHGIISQILALQQLSSPQAGGWGLQTALPSRSHQEGLIHPHQNRGHNR